MLVVADEQEIKHAKFLSALRQDSLNALWRALQSKEQAGDI